MRRRNVVAATWDSAGLSSGLVSYWAMRTNTSTTVFDEYGTNTGSAANGALLGDAYGKRDAGIGLDGINDYLDIGDKSNLSFGNTTADSAFSIAAWIYITGWDETYSDFIVASKYQGIVNDQGEYSMALASEGSLSLSLIDRQVNVRETKSTGAGAVSTGVWTHVAATYNGVGGSGASAGINLYVNGVLSTNATTSDAGIYVAMHNTAMTLSLGASLLVYSTPSYSVGRIDECGIWSRELSSGDIYNLYSIPLYAPYKP
jgi:hypothetical protein